MMLTMGGAIKEAKSQKTKALIAPNSDRLAFLDGLRALAALYVVIGHLVSIVDPKNLTGGQSCLPYTIRMMVEPFRQGHLAVAAFIVISGFSLSVSAFRPGLGGTANRVSIAEFFKRRAKRILPPYYACLLFSTLVAVYVTSQQNKMPFLLYVPVTPQNFLAHIFLIQNMSLDWMYKINGVLWSIALEAQLYLLFPALIWCTRNLGKLVTIALGLSVTYAVVTRIPDANRFYVWFIPLFAAGIAASQAAYRPNRHIGTLPGLGLLIAVLGLSLGVLALSFTEQQPLQDLPFGFGIAGLLYALTVGGSLEANKVLSNRALVAIGAFSYSLYLMHHPIEQVIYVYRPVFLTDPVVTLGYLFVVGLPCILLLTWVFYLIFERPFIRTAKSARIGKSRAVSSLPLRAAAKKPSS